MSLAIPMIHSNGTSREQLQRDLEAAVHSLRDAREALQQTAPNGRDYYVYQGSTDVFNQARSEYDSRQRRLQEVIDELMEIWGAIV